MTETKAGRAHLVTGGFPTGSMAGHDHDYARLRLLGLLPNATFRPRLPTTSPTSRNGSPSAAC
jgi:hypothetical protein